MNDEETIAYYGKRAGEYDKIYLRDNPERQAELAAMYALSCRTLAGKHVLDLACGTGFWTRIVADTAASIVGLDINPTMLAEAERKKYHCPTQFVAADIYHPPLIQPACDGLLATFVISHVRRQDMAGLAQTIRALLPPKAPAFFCDNNPITEVTRDVIPGDDGRNTYKKRQLESGEEYTILKNYFSREELPDLLAPWGRLETLVYREYYWAAVLTME